MGIRTTRIWIARRRNGTILAFPGDSQRPQYRSWLQRVYYGRRQYRKDTFTAQAPSGRGRPRTGDIFCTEGLRRIGLGELIDQIPVGEAMQVQVSIVPQEAPRKHKAGGCAA